jgi:hypothetical protein
METAVTDAEAPDKGFKPLVKLAAINKKITVKYGSLIINIYFCTLKVNNLYGKMLSLNYC